MCDKCAPSIPVTRLLVRSGFGYSVGCVEAAASNDNQKIKSLGGCLVLNNTAVCGGRLQLKFFVRVWYDMWKSVERDSVMVFYVPLMCCEYGYIFLMARVQPSQRAAALCNSAFTGSKYALCIQPSALDLSVNANIRGPCNSCGIVVYIDISYASNSNRFSVSLPFHYYGILHFHAKPLLI